VVEPEGRISGQKCVDIVIRYPVPLLSIINPKFSLLVDLKIHFILNEHKSGMPSAKYLLKIKHDSQNIFFNKNVIFNCAFDENLSLTPVFMKQIFRVPGLNQSGSTTLTGTGIF
jgi:hypothetical protein